MNEHKERKNISSKNIVELVVIRLLELLYCYWWCWIVIIILRCKIISIIYSNIFAILEINILTIYTGVPAV